MKDKECLKCPLRNVNYVPAEGPITAKIAIIGEAPGYHEDQELKPFVGGAGKVLNMLLGHTGIHRGDIFIDNVIKCRPPDNKINSREGALAVQYCKHRLIEELKQLRNLKVLVPMGNTSLSVLGYNYKIGDVRGHTIYSDTFGRIVPTYHPAYYLRQWHEFYTGTKDWQKIQEHSMGLLLPIKYYDNTEPSVLDVEMFARNVDVRAQNLQPTDSLKVSLDLETYFFNGSATNTAIKLVGLSVNESQSIVIPFINQDNSLYWKTKEEEIRAYMAIASILENPRVALVIHNALFDALVLMNHGFKINASIYDTEIGQYLLYHPSPHSLNYVASIYANTTPWKEQKNSHSDKEFRKYNGHDTRILQSIVPSLDKDIEDNGLRYLFNITMGNIIPTCKIMMNGIYVDQQRLGEVEGILNEKIDNATTALRAFSGVPYLNPNSGDQVAEILFNQFRLKSTTKTKSKKKLSTDEGVIKRLLAKYTDPGHRDVYKFLENLLEYRKYAKQKSTYIDNVRKYISDDGRIRTNLKMHTAVTGRYASTDPNLLNLPARADADGFIRSIFAAPPGKVLLELDYSQEELYLYAVIANDEAWLEAYYSNKDIHEINMIDMIGHYEEKYRTFIKNFVYGLIYGSDGSEIEKVAPRELMERISIPQMLQNLRDTHPSLFAYRNAILGQIKKTKKVKSVFGRTRWYPNDLTKADERSAINFPIQATAADIIHMTSPKIEEVLDDEMGDKLVLQLYDAFYIEVKEDRANEVAHKCKTIMEEPIYSPSGYEFRLKVDVKVGNNMSKKALEKLEV